ncbi:hypothetical protein SUGI_1109310 [Cryptomeria japonica]|nr:hypothetical protein SUGI_1109310 [Cryptomeria japonica]
MFWRLSMVSGLGLSAFRVLIKGVRERFFQFQNLPSVPRLTPTVVCQRPKHLVTCALNISRGESGGPEENKNVYLEKVKNILEDCCESIKAFPWKKAYTKFLHHLFSLAFWVAKWLSIPVVIISSLSEMSYCGWENKELLIPFGMVVGIVLAGILKETAIELSEDVQEGKFPWHLLIIGAFFALIKLPGPYYPYWLRVFLPHFATGGLLRTLWSANIWYKTQSTAPKLETDPGINLN